MVNKPEYKVGPMIKESPEARKAYREIKTYGFKPNKIRDWLLEFAPQGDYGSPSQVAWIPEVSRKIALNQNMTAAIEPFEIIENQGWKTSQDVAKILQTWAEDLRSPPQKKSKTESSDIDRLRDYEKIEERREEKKDKELRNKSIETWKNLWKNLPHKGSKEFRNTFKKWIDSIVTENEWISTASGQPLVEFIDKFEAHKDFLQALKKANIKEFQHKVIKPLQRLKRLALIYPYDDPEMHEEGRDEAIALHNTIELLKSL